MAKGLVGSVSRNNMVVLALLTAGFFIGARVGIRLALVQPFATPIWFPAGGAIAAFIVFGYRIWPALLLGSFLGHVTALGFVSASFFVPIGAMLEGLTGAYLVNSFAGGSKAFETAKGVFWFAFATCVCAPSVNAIPLALDSFRDANFSHSAGLVLSWWLSHGIGALVVAPFFILLARSADHHMTAQEAAELLVLLAGLVFVCLLVFGPLSLTVNKSHIVRAWMCVPFLIWAAFRFCPLEAAGTTLILFGSAIWGTVHGYGLFVAKDFRISLAVLDTFIGIIGTMTLVVAAMVVERRRSEVELLSVQTLLRLQVEGKQRELAEKIEALDLEMAGHARTKRSLQHNQEQLRTLAARAKFGESGGQAERIISDENPA